MNDAPAANNKRRHPRFIVEGVQGRMVFASRVEIINISLGGVALTADRRLNIGVEYSLRLEKEGHGVDLRGVVVWSTLSGLRRQPAGESAPEYSAGLRFSGLVSPELQSLLDFIDSNRVLEEQRLSGLRFVIESPDMAVLQTPESYTVRLISRSGMLIETEHTLEMDHVYPMEILPPGADPIRCKGRVASFFEVLDASPRHYEVGIEFVDLGADDVRRLDGFIAELARGAG